VTEPDRVVEARLEEIGPPVPDAGFLHSLQVARYSDPALTAALEPGVLPADAAPGDRHRLELSERVPPTASYDVPWALEGPVWYCLRLEVLG